MSFDGERTWCGGGTFLTTRKEDSTEMESSFLWWALTDSNRRPSACKADALNQLS